jgi:hypothetical protein
MEMPPFGRGSSDIIWGLPFFGLIILGLSIPGLTLAIRTQRDLQGQRKLIIAGLIMNGLSLAIPIIVLLFGIIRVLL